MMSTEMHEYDTSLTQPMLTQILLKVKLVCLTSPNLAVTSGV